MDGNIVSHRATTPLGNHQCACTRSGGWVRLAEIAFDKSAPRYPSSASLARHDEATSLAMFPVYARVSYSAGAYRKRSTEIPSIISFRTRPFALGAITRTVTPSSASARASRRRNDPGASPEWRGKECVRKSTLTAFKAPAVCPFPVPALRSARAAPSSRRAAQPRARQRSRSRRRRCLR